MTVAHFVTAFTEGQRRVCRAAHVTWVATALPGWSWPHSDSWPSLCGPHSILTRLLAGAGSHGRTFNLEGSSRSAEITLDAPRWPV